MTTMTTHIEQSLCLLAEAIKNVDSAANELARAELGASSELVKHAIRQHKLTLRARCSELDTLSYSLRQKLSDWSLLDEQRISVNPKG